MEKISGIYKIESKINSSRFYIGSSSDLIRRWRDHLYNLKKQIHRNIVLQNHYNKHGESDLQFSILLRCEKENLVNIEQQYIDSYKPYFNICKIAGSTLGYKHTEKSIEYFRKIKKGIRFSEETKKKMRKPKPEQFRLKMIGNKNGCRITNEMHNYIVDNLSKLTQCQMAEELKIHQSTISKHIKNYINEGKIDPS